jgi:hypothetical protein
MYIFREQSTKRDPLDMGLIADLRNLGGRITKKSKRPWFAARTLFT